MKTIAIKSIKNIPYKGKVYNLELQTNSNKDDLFWIEQNTGIVTHNCLVKDLNALICKAQELGVDPKVMKAVWEKNLEVRPERDWEKLTGRAISETD